MSDVMMIVGGSIDDDALAFVSAWKRVERGEQVQERALAFESWESLATVMTGERYRFLGRI